MRSLNIYLSDSTFDKLEEFSKEFNESLTDIVKRGIGLVIVAYAEQKKGNSLTITNKRGKTIKKIVFDA